jgi:hypothetical protein
MLPQSHQVGVDDSLVQQNFVATDRLDAARDAIPWRDPIAANV